MNRTKKNSYKNINSAIKEHPGYTQIPNFIYSLGLSKHALLVSHYLIRCANRKKGGICFPSVPDISKKCSIPSDTTTRAAIKELHERGLITKMTRGRKNFYVISELIYIAIDRANRIDCNIGDLDDLPTYSDGIFDEEFANSRIESNSGSISPEYGEIVTNSDDENHHHMLPNKTNITRLYNNTNKQDSHNTDFENVTAYGKASTTGKTTSFAEANEFYQSLTESERKSYDMAARAYEHPDEVTTGGTLMQSRTARFRFYDSLKLGLGLLMGVNHCYDTLGERESHNGGASFSSEFE